MCVDTEAAVCGPVYDTPPFVDTIVCMPLPAKGTTTVPSFWTTGCPPLPPENGVCDRCQVRPPSLERVIMIPVLPAHST